MNVVNSILSALEHHQMRRHKDVLKQKLSEAVEALDPVELLDRYRRGEQEHGVMTAEALCKMDTHAMMKEEVADSFWYHVMGEVRGLLQSAPCGKKHSSRQSSSSSSSEGTTP